MDFAQLAPVSKAEAAAAGVAVAPVASPAAAPSVAPVSVEPIAALPEEEPQFLDEEVRRRVVLLDHPMRFAGREYRAIHLRRMAARDVGRYFEQLAELAAKDPGAKLLFPIFYHEDGSPVPPKVLDRLDASDDERVIEEAQDFLPPRLRRLKA
ncbi:phage tail assembly protein [Methylobacterium gnaphalii]|uniref:Uncharacterized protein n=1 Tax=Methylobacterium gnaphalii TaxID=1010610 RepID=A0A512JPF4_9HYPH|nr:phage tail assembly protein [Methylobacterium gnaphalii]GEP11831.1 hypothetical protein MGN01_36760 [Methylobacterium gnaphalii]GJD69415.1 hypothetical protein MMMDOFMJ_2346 [Methylobacterium gnaphalii]GLS51394.1 hypothetical protein GCM10007885_42510 [Methylobacterium gnaphalii]